MKRIDEETGEDDEEEGRGKGRTDELKGDKGEKKRKKARGVRRRETKMIKEGEGKGWARGRERMNIRKGRRGRRVREGRR